MRMLIKTANIILVYQYSRNVVEKQSSRVISLTSSLAQHAMRVKDFVLSLGKPTEEVEPLDSGAVAENSRKEAHQ